MNERNQSCGGTSTKCRKAPGQSRAILTRLELPSGVGRVAVKVRYPSRVRCAYLSKPLKVRTAYPTWYGFHRRGCKPICMIVRCALPNLQPALARTAHRNPPDSPLCRVTAYINHHSRGDRLVAPTLVRLTRPTPMIAASGTLRIFLQVHTVPFHVQCI